MGKTRRRILVAFATAGLLAGLAACGTGGGSSDGDTATLTGTLDQGTAARTAAVVAEPVDVVAVNEQGDKVDEALGITDAFTLHLPWGHEYVLIFSDARGILGAMVYGAEDQAAFQVEPGVVRIDLGAVTIDPENRRVRIQHDTDLTPPEDGPYQDSDDDGIPDRVDDDRDNDGIPNDLDVGEDGADLSLDHDNDGVPMHQDADDDDDGVTDTEDDHPMDHDNDGVDDDRDAGLGDPAVGETVYAENCAACHGPDGGNLDRDDVSVREIAEVLYEGEDADEAGGMQPMPGLLPYAADLSAYLRSVVPALPGSGDPAAGETVYAANCAGCHGSDGGDLDCEDDLAEEIAEVLYEGEDADEAGGMRPMPDLVPHAADLAAYVCYGNPGGDLPPADADNDGVADADDQCPDTPAGTAVDAQGCPVTTAPTDADGDGVADGADQCANTPAGVAVDAQGCPLDTDGDGVADYLDACPSVAGTGADGCPVQPARPAALDDGTCTMCHGDKAASVSCANAKWTAHGGGRVSTTVYDEVSTWATGGTCP